MNYNSNTDINNDVYNNFKSEEIEANSNTNNFFNRISITTNLDSIKNENDDSLFQKCYYTCKSCKIEGNNITHNCLKCNSNYSFEIYKNNYINCYNNSNYGDYYNNELKNIKANIISQYIIHQN